MRNFKIEELDYRNKVSIEWEIDAPDGPMRMGMWFEYGDKAQMFEGMSSFIVLLNKYK